MENREVAKLWDCNVDLRQRPLRRPNMTSTNESKTDTPPQSSQNKEVDADYSILTKTSLRVDAKEWFPSSYFPTNVASPNLYSVQNRLQKIKIHENNVPPEGSHRTIVPTQDQVILDTSRLTEIVRSLTYDPGQFDSVVDTFMAVLRPYLEDMYVVSNVADMIFDQALYEPSFRYNAARLCSVVDEHCPLFRSRLHVLCEKELQACRHQQGLTLLLAELYMQLHYEKIYGHSLLGSIKNLITLGSSDDIKCICQTLKLAGSSLEVYNKEALDTIFTELEAIKPLLSSSSLQNLLESVFKLRMNQWGHGTSQSGNTNSSFSQEQNGFVPASSDDGLILYGPDGQEITTEEREFLRANFEDPNDYLGDESSDPDDLFDPEPEMDEEIQAAFRVFVKMSKR